MKKSKKQLAWKSHSLSLKMSSKLKASRMLDPAKFPHLKKCKKVVLEDRISALPDDLLSQILALLSLKEAVTTSILSSRWKYLWTTRPNLIFGYDRVFERMDYKTYVRTINKVLELYSGRGLRDFRVFYPLRSGASCHLNYWIDFAITSGVSRLEVNLDTIVRDGRKYLYALPADIFQSGLKRNLSSNYGMSLPTPSVTLGDHFKSLIDLYIKSVNISDQVFDIILCSCSSLEKFRLVNSYSLVHAKHSGPHLKLKSFEMHFCTCLESVELVAPNLQSFKYRGFKRNIYLKGSPQLVNLGVDSIYAFDEKLSLVYPEEKHFIFDQFTACVSRLECLVAGAHLFAGRRSTKFSIFRNLKQLALDVMSYEFLRQSFHVAAFFISAAPFLQQLELNLPGVYSWRKRELRMPTTPPHLNLKEVRLSGFRGLSCNMEFLIYVIDHAIALEMIEITTSTVIEVASTLYRWSHREQPSAAPDFNECDKCVRQLRQGLRPNTRLIYLDECDGKLKRIGLS